MYAAKQWQQQRQQGRQEGECRRRQRSEKGRKQMKDGESEGHQGEVHGDALGAAAHVALIAAKPRGEQPVVVVEELRRRIQGSALCQAPAACCRWMSGQLMA